MLKLSVDQKRPRFRLPLQVNVSSAWQPAPEWAHRGEPIRMMVFGDSVDANLILDVCAEATAHGIPVSSHLLSRDIPSAQHHTRDNSCSQVWTGILLGCAYCKCNANTWRAGLLGLCKAQHWYKAFLDPQAPPFPGCCLKKQESARNLGFRVWVFRGGLAEDTVR